jgi:hypothetical protein
MMFGANGVDGSTGAYLAPAGGPAALVRHAALQQGPARESLARLAWGNQKMYAVRYGADPLRLDSSGWGVLFAQGESAAVRDALLPLLDWRREQANAAKPYFREYADQQGYRAGMSKDSFLVEHGSAPGQPADPRHIPYYLLLVGGPDRIPFEFQYELGLQYAVGRIAFDSPREYASYARSVVAAEQGRMKRSRSAAFFGPGSPDDDATAQSSMHLVAPLAAAVRAREENSAWDCASHVGAYATKARLASLVGRGPALLFSATHGVGYPCGHPQQARHQGALLCQDWPGPVEHAGPLPPAFFFSGDDAARQDGPAGLVAMHFACYGAGTPELDDFAPRQADAPAPRIAPRPLVAPLVQRMLGHPGGGALAVVGHIDRAWGWSFAWPGTRQAQLAVFEDTLFRMLDGQPVGHAMEVFRIGHGELAAALTTQLQDVANGKRIDNAEELAAMWTAHNNARNYVIMGDPAVRLAV